MVSNSTVKSYFGFTFIVYIETKHQWARDDPAFLVLLSLYLCSKCNTIFSYDCFNILFLVSSLGFTIALHLGFFGFWKFLCWVVFIDCIGIGLCIASVMWLISNNFFLNKKHGTSFPVEWAYAFDVHLNALFPILIILHGIQLLLFGGKE